MSAALPIVQPEPYPIAGMDTGTFLAREPWLSPQNAFTRMRDAYTFRGRIRPRPGFQRWAQCGQATSGTQTASSVGGGAPFNITYSLDDSSEYICLESVQFTYTDSTAGALSATVGPQQFGEYAPFGVGSEAWGAPVYETGTSTLIGYVIQRYDTTVGGTPVSIPAAALVDWSLHSAYVTGDATFGSMTWQTDPRTPITGIQSYRDRAGDEYLVATNTRRLFVFNETLGFFEDKALSDTFTGNDDDLFWMWPAEDDLILTNNVDAPRKYTGSSSTLAALTTTIGAGPATVQVALLAVVFRNRLIYFNTQEAGTRHPGRGRWSRAGAFETLDTQDFEDSASEYGAIVTAQKIADRLFVGFQRGWLEFVFTGDEQRLFEWQETTFVYGANAKLGAIADGERILARTETGIQAVDPNVQYAADEAIPDYVIGQMDTNASGYTAATRSLPNRQFWWAMVNAASGDGKPNEVLVGQYQEDQKLRWSSYDIDFTAFATFRSGTAPNWDDIDSTWDAYDRTWDEASQSGFPIVIAGDKRGQFSVAGGASDLRSDTPATLPEVTSLPAGPQPIPMAVTTIRLNPAPGYRVFLGWVDLYIEASASVDLTLEARGDTDTAAYFARTVTFTPAGGKTKLLRRVRVGKSAVFHELTLRANTTVGYSIDAVIPYFRAAGRMRNFG